MLGEEAAVVIISMHSLGEEGAVVIILIMAMGTLIKSLEYKLMYNVQL